MVGAAGGGGGVGSPASGPVVATGASGDEAVAAEESALPVPALGAPRLAATLVSGPASPPGPGGGSPHENASRAMATCHPRTAVVRLSRMTRQDRRWR